MKKSFAAIKITSQNSLGFDPKEYSRFKYGSKTIARKFGKILAERFFQSKEFHEIICATDKPIVVCSSPYHNIPTATFAMKDYFVAELNKKLVDFGMDSVSECKIYRTPSYIQDYGEMNEEDRERVISGDDFYIDEKYLEGKFVIFLDDIRITGAHERRVEKMIQSLSVEFEYMYIYFAELTAVTVDPKIENYLNFNFISSLLDIDWIIKNDKFLFNTRVVKYIVGANHQEFTNFIRYQSDIFRETLYKYAVANSYHKHEEFRENIAELRSLL